MAKHRSSDRQLVLLKKDLGKAIKANRQLRSRLDASTRASSLSPGGIGIGSPSRAFSVDDLFDRDSWADTPTVEAKQTYSRRCGTMFFCRRCCRRLCSFGRSCTFLFVDDRVSLWLSEEANSSTTRSDTSWRGESKSTRHALLGRTTTPHVGTKPARSSRRYKSREESEEKRKQNAQASDETTRSARHH